MSTSMYNTTLLGWDDGTFYPLHIIAIVCMLCSFSASVVVILTSFKTHKKRFFSWSLSDRFVVYLAVCEMGFNFVHMFDHVTMVITKDHVRPLELCQFYAFLMVVLVFTKNLILVTIALNAFLLMRFRHQIKFGSRDWRLFAGVLALPLANGILALSSQQLGPAGAFCLIRPGLSVFIGTTIVTTLILSVNTTLYLLTWFHIRRETRRIRSAIGTHAQSRSAHIEAAKTMTLFITIFTVQWWAVVVYGIWQILTNDVPPVVFILVVIFTNIGGCLNLIVFLSILKKQRGTLAPRSELTTSSAANRTGAVNKKNESYTGQTSI